MSWLLNHHRVEPSGSRLNRISAISMPSVTPAQLNVAIDEIIKLNPPSNTCVSFFRGNALTLYGKSKQFLKGLAITILPVLLLTGLIANTFITTFSNYSKSAKIRRTLLYSVELGRLIHYLQEERDVSALYLTSIEEKTKLLLLERYAATDKSLEELTFWTIGPTLIREEFQSKEKFLSYLNKHRYELSTLQLSIVHELEMYTTLIRVFITWLYDAITEEQSGSIWRSLVAYQEVVIAKEYMGLERALGTVYYSTGHFSSIDVYLVFLESQDIANATFLSAKRYSDLVHDLYEKNINVRMNTFL
ncbi:uncharacterized protein LOC121389810 [Gigantopelta aegis]|uniref:uncharacterized protein LOC121389810 n=1 Tax=Gigantopelta aegis TaxID=1735272 RepID=UPI001B88B694|nr:uncharacterized protein LOC121389810 [Gigantopelta aegis]